MVAALAGAPQAALSQPRPTEPASQGEGDAKSKNGIEEGLEMIGGQWMLSVDLLRENKSREALRLLRSMAISLDSLGKNLDGGLVGFEERRTLLPRLLILDSTVKASIRALDENDSEGAMDLLVSVRPSANSRKSDWDLPLADFHRTIMRQLQRAATLLHEGNDQAALRMVMNVVAAFGFFESLPHESDEELQRASIRTFPLFVTAKSAVAALEEGDPEAALALIETLER